MEIASENERKIDKEKVLEKAEKRNFSIPRLLARGKVHLRRNIQSSVFAELAAVVYIGDIVLNGESNLRSALEISKTAPLIISSTHKSDGDTIAIQQTLYMNGFFREAMRTGYPAGLKMLERPYIEPFVRSVDSFLVATPYDVQENQTALALDLSEEEREKLLQCKDYYEKLNRRAFIEMYRFSTKEGGILIPYLEATRSRKKGVLQDAPDEMEVYFKIKNAQVLPIEVHGVEAVCPPEAPFRWEKIRGAHITFTAGEHYPASDIFTTRLPAEISGRLTKPLDIAMAKIAKLNPELVKADQLKYYEEVISFSSRN